MYVVEQEGNRASRKDSAACIYIYYLVHAIPGVGLVGPRPVLGTRDRDADGSLDPSLPRAKSFRPISAGQEGTSGPRCATWIR